MYTYFVSFKGGNKKKPYCNKKSWYDAIERFFQFHNLLLLEMDVTLTGLFLFNLETKPCKNFSDTNLVKIHWAVIEILSFSCSALFLVTTAILESQTAKNITDSYKKHSGQKLDQFQPMGLEILSFSCLCYFYNSPWRPSWIVNLHKHEVVPFRDHCDQIWTKYIHVFSRYWHLSKIGLVTTK